MSYYNKYIIYCEGQTEKKILTLLGIKASISVFNLVEKNINSKIRTFNKSDNHHIFVIFDADTKNYSNLIQNINILISLKNVKVYLIQQNKNLEDELKLSCGTTNIHKLINCKSASDFKRDLCQCNTAQKLIEAINFDLFWKSELTSELQKFSDNKCDFSTLKNILNK